MASLQIKFMRLHPDAKLPTWGTPLAAGIDLYADHDLSLAPGAYGLVGTGLAIELPPGYEGQVRPRSGWSLKKGVTVLNSPATIDEDYRGEVLIILINHGPSIVDIKKGDRICQLLLRPVYRFEVSVVTELSPSDRGTSGFGSTGS